MNARLNRRLDALERQREAHAGVHIMIPPGWMADEEYAAWHVAELAKAPLGARRMAVRFVLPGEVTL